MDWKRLLQAILGMVILASASAGAVRGQDERPFSSPTTAESTPDAGQPDVGFGQAGRSFRWTAAAEFILLERTGGAAYPLVTTVPASQAPTDAGTAMLNATDLHAGSCGGPRIDLIHHGDGDADLQVVYFQIGGWNALQSVGPTPNDWLVMQAPGDFVQTQDNKATQMMTWGYTSQLSNAEVNVRFQPWDRVTLLAGFRWVNLSEELQGNLPPERTVPFWDTHTKNNLYGFQVGAEGTLWERGRFSLGCTGKAGVFDNHTEEATSVSIFRILYEDSDATDQAAFVGEIGLQGKYQLTQQLALRAGYEALWVQGVALAPGQIPNTVCHKALLPQDISVQSLGVSCGSSVLYYGATVGLEYAF